MARPRAYSPQLRGRLLGAATVTLATGGSQALSLRALAAEAETSTNAIYTLFGGRDQLIQAVIDDAVDSLMTTLTAAAGDGTSLTDLMALSMSYFTWARQNPALYQLIYRDHPPEVVRPEESRCPLFGLVCHLVADGVLRDKDPDDVAHSLHAAAHGLAGLENDDHDPAQLQELFSATIRGWLAEPSSLP